MLFYLWFWPTLFMIVCCCGAGGTLIKQRRRRRNRTPSDIDNEIPGIPEQPTYPTDGTCLATTVTVNPPPYREMPPQPPGYTAVGCTNEVYQPDDINNEHDTVINATNITDNSDRSLPPSYRDIYGSVNTESNSLSQSQELTSNALTESQQQ